MTIKNNQEKEVLNATLFFQNVAKNQAPNIKPLTTNKENTAILVDKSDNDLYDWALNG